MNLCRIFGFCIVILVLFNVCLIVLLSNPGYSEETYTFEDEIVGSSGDLISFIDEDLSDLNCSASINLANNSFNKYLQLEDKNSSGKVSIVNFRKNDNTIFIVEFDFGKNEDENIFQIYFHESGVGRIIWLQIINNILVCRESGSNWKRIKSNVFKNGIISHFSIELDNKNNKFRIKIDGINEGTYNFDTKSKKGFDYMKLESVDYNYSDFSCFIDNIHFKWIRASIIISSTLILIIESVFLLIITLILVFDKLNQKVRRLELEEEK